MPKGIETGQFGDLNDDKQNLEVEDVDQESSLPIGVGEQQYNITSRKKSVEFNDSIKNETGISGYDRTMIPWQNLSEVIGNSIGEPGLEIASQEELQKIIKLHRKEIDPFASQLCRSFSDGEFIRGTYNHVRNMLWGRTSANSFFKQKAFLQKIFHPEAIKTTWEEEESLFGHANFVICDILTNKPTQKIFSVNGLEVSQDFNFGMVDRNFTDVEGKISALDQLITKMRENRSFMITKAGLSVMQRELWNTPYSEIFNQTIFGFNTRNEAFGKYIDQIDVVMQNLLEARKIDNHLYRLTTPSLKKLPEEFRGFGDDHPRIPVCIGHPDIAELRWCYGRYASIPTKNGLNLVKFK